MPGALKTAKELLRDGQPCPSDVSPESLPAAMAPSKDACGHGDGYLPRCFLRVTPLDRVGRRALWMHATPFDGSDATREPEWDGQLIELKAGREGDDASFELRAGDVVTPQTIQRLVDVLMTMKLGLECYEETP